MIKIVLGLFIMILAGVLVLFGVSMLSDVSGDCTSKNCRACIYSEHYTSNYSGEMKYFLGKCIYDEPFVYESNEKCGTFGISCYETSEPYYRMARTTKCFVLETGEPC